MNSRRRIGVLAVAAALASSMATALLAVPASAAPSITQKIGDVVSTRDLDRNLWIPGAASAEVLTYVTTDTFGEKALSTGTVFLPPGTAPEGGWPVISWAHGTSGLGDACAPSLIGPTYAERDLPYLANWLAQGYAIVASDYAGLGTPGLPTYLDGRTTAHNVVDMVKAGRNYSEDLSRSWVAVGQSQGGGAAIYTARYATEFGGPDLDYRGAVGTGTPAYIEKLISIGGPGVPPVVLPSGLTAYVAYIGASLRYAHPELGLDDILTPLGKKYADLAETTCVTDFEAQLDGVTIGDFFTAPLTGLPNFTAVLDDYMAMPETGFDKPFFMGNGLQDIDVPFPTTAAYVARLTANGQPVTFRAYNTDHSGAFVQSQADTIPFVANLFR
ncbi:lipase [Rhodococcus sp. 05-2254-6]|nr:lipase [Rhodococcus sp. 05-2254-6]OZE40141.1 lipase [Rhodococcus sp. 05-2254-4]OZE49710.1 lipase [Rhodococcus sp. 05-2254-3]OZE50348.1 lipase [Rhodococcus sp. 05-2254-2]OZF47880.1 lipase [Rhodococcus sp. 14-1411-2a]